MGETPTIANVVAQVAISGSVEDGRAKASEQQVVKDLAELGISEVAAQYAVNKAVEHGVLNRITGKQLSVKAVFR